MRRGQVTEHREIIMGGNRAPRMRWPEPASMADDLRASSRVTPCLCCVLFGLPAEKCHRQLLVPPGNIYLAGLTSCLSYAIRIIVDQYLPRAGSNDPQS